VHTHIFGLCISQYQCDLHIRPKHTKAT